MKKEIKLFLFLLILTVLSCEPPAAPVDNPNDPTTGTKPSVEIVEGPLDLIAIRSTKFTWRGNITATKFSYRLRTDDPTTNTWSSWSIDSTITFESLDDDKFNFEVKAQSIVGSESEITKKTFSVDILSTPAIAIFPELSKVTKDSTFNLYFHAKDVRALLALHTVIKYDPTKLTIYSVDTVNYFVKKNNASFFAIIDSISTGRILVDMGVAMGAPKGLTGTGRILKLKCKKLVDELITVELLGSETAARDTSNTQINLKSFSNARIMGK